MKSSIVICAYNEERTVSRVVRDCCEFRPEDEVIVVDDEITIQTAEGQVLVGMGQSAYREGFELKVGDEITVLGFHEDGEFKAGTVENLTTGETITLRDETGRPMWAGQGRLKNQGRRPELVEG